MEQLFYENLVPTRNMNKPKFMGLLRSVIGPGLDQAAVVDSLTTAFDIENAAGAQLDIIGEILGLKRLLDVIPYEGSREMDDEEYRLMLKFKSMKNAWDGTTGGAVKIYQQMAESGLSVTYKDHQDMSVKIEFDDIGTDRMIAMITNCDILPIPAGVSVAVEFVGEVVSTSITIDANVTGVDYQEQVSGIVTN